MAGFEARGGAQGSPQKRHNDFGYNFSSLCDNVRFWDVWMEKEKCWRGGSPDFHCSHPRRAFDFIKRRMKKEAMEKCWRRDGEAMEKCWTAGGEVLKMFGEVVEKCL